MKRFLIVFFTLLCLAAMLMGCSGNAGPAAPIEAAADSTQATADTASEDAAVDEDAPDAETAEDPTYTPDEIAKNNSIEALLSHHSAVYYVRTFLDEQAQTVTVIRGQYTMQDGFLQMDTVYEDESGSATYYRQGYADATYAGAEYAQSADGQLYMTLFADNDSYEAYIGGDLLTASSENETVTESSMQDGAVIVTTRTEYRDVADLYDVTMYYIDPETNDLLYMETSSYNTGDDSVVATVRTQIVYDTPETFGVKPFEAITGSDDYCELTRITDPQGEDMAVCWYPVAHGTDVMFAVQENTKLYSDDALTQELDPQSIDISSASCNVYAVYSK